jgi:hypothetical protein
MSVAPRNASETADVDRAFSMVLMVCDAESRKAALALLQSLIAYVGNYSREKFEAISIATEEFVTAVNRGEFTESSRQDEVGQPTT